MLVFLTASLIFNGNVQIDACTGYVSLGGGKDL